MRQVDELRSGQHRASLLREHAVQIGGSDEVAVEHHLRRLAVHRADEPAGAERRRARVSDHHHPVAQVKVPSGVEVEHLARADRLHQKQRGDALERDGRRRLRLDGRRDEDVLDSLLGGDAGKL